MAIRMSDSQVNWVRTPVSSVYLWAFWSYRPYMPNMDHIFLGESLDKSVFKDQLLCLKNVQQGGSVALWPQYELRRPGCPVVLAVISPSLKPRTALSLYTLRSMGFESAQHIHTYINTYICIDVSIQMYVLVLMY